MFFDNSNGKMLSTKKFEQHIQDLLQARERYDRVEKSAELKEFLELDKIVKDDDFQAKKQELTTRRYKDTEEYQKSERLRKLEGKWSVRCYFRRVADPEFKELLKFLDSPDSYKLQDENEWKNDARLKRLHGIYDSRRYRKYEAMKQSGIIDEIEELRKETSTPEFKKNNAFWANPKRWETTEEGKQDLRHAALLQKPDIRFFIEQDPKQMEDLRTYNLIWQDKFANRQNWQVGQGFSDKALKSQYSLTSQHNANNNGRNTTVGQKGLRIDTRKEHVKAPAWDAQKGFCDAQFDYTSDTLNSAGKLAIKNGGIVMAKVKLDGKVHHSLYLTTGKREIALQLFNTDGKYVQVGLCTRNSQNLTNTGIKGSDEFIYSLVWENRELVWYINNKEVGRMYDTEVPQNEDLFLVLTSFLPKEEKAKTGYMQVSWIRAFKK